MIVIMKLSHLLRIFDTSSFPLSAMRSISGLLPIVPMMTAFSICWVSSLADWRFLSGYPFDVGGQVRGRDMDDLEIVARENYLSHFALMNKRKITRPKLGSDGDRLSKQRRRGKQDPTAAGLQQ